MNGHLGEGFLSREFPRAVRSDGRSQLLNVAGISPAAGKGIVNSGLEKNAFRRIAFRCRSISISKAYLRGAFFFVYRHLPGKKKGKPILLEKMKNENVSTPLIFHFLFIGILFPLSPLFPGAGLLPVPFPRVNALLLPPPPTGLKWTGRGRKYLRSNGSGNSLQKWTTEMTGYKKNLNMFFLSQNECKNW